MRLILEKQSHKHHSIKPCLICQKSVIEDVHHHRKIKGFLIHLGCADKFFSGFFLLSVMAPKVLKFNKARSRGLVKTDKCAICGEHASGGKSVRHRIVCEGLEVEVKIHRTCFFDRFNMKYDFETKRATANELPSEAHIDC